MLGLWLGQSRFRTSLLETANINWHVFRQWVKFEPANVRGSKFECTASSNAGSVPRDRFGIVANAHHATATAWRGMRASLLVVMITAIQRAGGARIATPCSQRDRRRTDRQTERQTDRTRDRRPAHLIKRRNIYRLFALSRPISLFVAYPSCLRLSFVSSALFSLLFVLFPGLLFLCRRFMPFFSFASLCSFVVFR